MSYIRRLTEDGCLAFLPVSVDSSQMLSSCECKIHEQSKQVIAGINAFEGQIETNDVDTALAAILHLADSKSYFEGCCFKFHSVDPGFRSFSEDPCFKSSSGDSCFKSSFEDSCFKSPENLDFKSFSEHHCFREGKDYTLHLALAITDKLKQLCKSLLHGEMVLPSVQMECLWSVHSISWQENERPCLLQFGSLHDASSVSGQKKLTDEVYGTYRQFISKSGTSCSCNDLLSCAVVFLLSMQACK